MNEDESATPAGEAPSERRDWQSRLHDVADGRYQLDRQLGFGGMATVFRARDERLRRCVAIKILHRHLIADPEHCARFRREAESIARLDHPGIVSIHDLLEIPGEFLAIVLEYIDGPRLDRALGDAPPLPPELAAALTIPLLDALQHAHDQGVVHRDLKPANILIDSSSLRITDFGIAHVADDSTLTKTGAILGSPHFMSPEMAEGQPVDGRSDLFSLGSILYLMVTGLRPFDGGSTPGVLRKIAEGRHRRADHVRETVGRNFASLLELFLATDPEDRPATAAAAKDLLETFVDDAFPEPPTLKAWIKNPESYTLEVGVVIEDSLRRRARVAVEEGDRRKALSKVERLMALAPGDSEVQELLESLHDDEVKRHRLIGGTFAVVVLLSLVAGGVALYDFSPSPPPEGALTDSRSTQATPPPPDASPPEPEADVGEATELAMSIALTARELADSLEIPVESDHGQDRSSPTTLPVAEVEPELESQAPADEESPNDVEADEVTASVVRFRLRPPSATLQIDDRQFDAMEASRGIELLPGAYELVATGPATETYRRTIEVTPDSDETRSVVLSWKDGYIRVQVDRDALIWVDGEQRPHRIDGGRAETIPISFGPADAVASEREVSLRVAARDDLERSRRKTVRVRPDTETPVAVTLHEH